MAPTWTTVVFQVVGILVGSALLLTYLRGVRREREARRATPESGLRPRHAGRGKRDARFHVAVFVTLAITAVGWLLYHFGSDDTRQRLRVLTTILSRGVLVFVGVAVASLVVLFVMLWRQRDPALKEAAELAAAGRHEEAIDALRRLIAERGETVNRLTALGALYMDRQRWDEALEQLRRAEAAGAPKPSTTNNKAVVLCKMGRIEEGLALLAGAAQEYPGDFSVACNHAHFLAEAGREPEAYDALERAECILDKYEARHVPEHWKKQIEPLREKLPTARGFPVIAAAAVPQPPAPGPPAWPGAGPPREKQ